MLTEQPKNMEQLKQLVDSLISQCEEGYTKALTMLSLLIDKHILNDDFSIREDATQKLTQ